MNLIESQLRYDVQYSTVPTHTHIYIYGEKESIFMMIKKRVDSQASESISVLWYVGCGGAGLDVTR